MIFHKLLLTGWYLSMEPQDSFISNLTDEKRPPFLPKNDKTLGMVVVSYLCYMTMTSTHSDKYKF